MSRSFKKESKSSSVLAFAGSDAVAAAATGAAATGSAFGVAFDAGVYVTSAIDSPGFKYILRTLFTKERVSSSHAL